MQQLTTAPPPSISARTPTSHADSILNATIPITSMDSLVHELRQPLSAIEHLAFYLQLVSEDQVICRHSQRIQDLIGQANEILEKALTRNCVAL
jgi:hypothetical protein